MRERYTEGLSEGELVPAARAAAPCDIQARPFACAAERQLAIPEIDPFSNLDVVDDAVGQNPFPC